MDTRQSIQYIIVKQVTGPNSPDDLNIDFMYEWCDFKNRYHEKYDETDENSYDILYYSENLKNKMYCGPLENGLPQGYGILYDQYGKEIYEGNWDNGRMNGHGTFHRNKSNAINGIGWDIVYSGFWENGLPHGYGSAHVHSYHGSSLFYEGEWINGKLHGKGKEYFRKSIYDASHISYEGDFKNGLYDGNGIEYYIPPSEDSYIRKKFEGKWRNGERIVGTSFLNNNESSISFEGCFWKNVPDIGTHY